MPDDYTLDPQELAHANLLEGILYFVPSLEYYPADAPAPSYGSDVRRQYRVLQANLGDGYSVRAQDGLNTTQETWNLSWENITEREAGILKNFFNAKGGFSSFVWKPLNEEEDKKWICVDYSENPIAYKRVTLTATFQRVYDL